MFSGVQTFGANRVSGCTKFATYSVEVSKIRLAEA